MARGKPLIRSRGPNGGLMNAFKRPDETLSACFVRASYYPRGKGGPNVLREARPRNPFPWTERHLQCVWYDPALRPEKLLTTSGESIIVENPGVWNLESGPDFLGAVARLEPGCRRIAGDVEVHVHPHDWVVHGHEKDPRYRRVRIHVTYFPGDGGPPGAIAVALKNVLAVVGEDLGWIDLTAYPYAARGAQPPCRARLASWNAGQIEGLLDAAGEERLRRKAEVLRWRVEWVGAEQALYEEVMSALGYKHNKSAFRRLAELVPVRALRETARGDVLRAYAVLLGVAGLLPAEQRNNWDDETRQWLRAVWDRWWRARERFEHVILPRSAWQIAHQRPANHPTRRLMAAALLFGGEEPLASRWRRLAQTNSADAIRALQADLMSLEDDYFALRWVIGGRRLLRPAALVGADRAAAIMVNVAVPFLAVTRGDQPFAAGFLDELPAESENALIRQTAHVLLGPDHPPSLYRSGLRRQGLLQIFHDFCLNDRSHCESCPLPGLLAEQEKWPELTDLRSSRAQ